MFPVLVPRLQPCCEAKVHGTPTLSNRKTRVRSAWSCAMLSAIVVVPEPDAPVRMTSLTVIFHA